MRLMLRLLEARRVVDDGGGLFADAPQHPPMIVGESAGDDVVDDQRADHAPLVYERAREQRLQILAVSSPAVGRRGNP